MPLQTRSLGKRIHRGRPNWSIVCFNIPGYQGVYLKIEDLCERPILLDIPGFKWIQILWHGSIYFLALESSTDG